MNTITLGISKDDIWGLLDRHLFYTFVKEERYMLSRRVIQDDVAISTYTPLDGSVINITLNWETLDLTVEYWSDSSTLVKSFTYKLIIEPHWSLEDLANYVFFEVNDESL